MSKKYDVAVKVGEYTDRDGNKKGRYQNVGAIIQGEKGPYLVLDRTFNPAGVPNPENKSSVLCSLFAPKDGQPSAKPAAQPAADDFDSVPF